LNLEHKFRLEGKCDEYEKQILTSNKNFFLDEALQALDDFENHKETYISEAGDVENWSGGKVDKEELKKWRENIKKMREQEL